MPLSDRPLERAGAGEDDLERLGLTTASGNCGKAIKILFKDRLSKQTGALLLPWSRVFRSLEGAGGGEGDLERLGLAAASGSCGKALKSCLRID